MKKLFGIFIVTICFSIIANTSFATLPTCKESDCKDKGVVRKEIGFIHNSNQPNTYYYYLIIEYDNGDYFYEKREVNYNYNQNYHVFKEPPSTPITITPPSKPITITPPSKPITITPPSKPITITPPSKPIIPKTPAQIEFQQPNYYSFNGYNIKGIPPELLIDIVNSLINGGINTPVKHYPNLANLESSIDYYEKQTKLYENQTQTVQNYYRDLAARLEAIKKEQAQARATIGDVNQLLKNRLASKKNNNESLFPYQFKAPQAEFRTRAEGLYYNLLNTKPKYENRQIAREMGLRTIEQADDSFINNNQVDADFYLDIGEALLDIVVGIDPVTGFGRDAYELFTGRNLINGEDLTIFERGISFYGVASFGIGSTMKGISNAILKLGRRFSNLIPGKYLESLPDAIKSGTKLAKNPDADDVINIIRELKQSTKEGTVPLLNGPIRDSYGAGAKGIDKILPTPEVASQKLQNIIDNLYKGTTNPHRIGTGTTADAARHELATGQPVFGKYHLRKVQESIRGLENWLQKNPNAPRHDRLVAQSLLNELRDAVGDAP